MVSAERGDGVDRLMDAVAKVAAQHGRRITTAELNRFFAEVCETVPPPIWRGKSVRIYYLTQAAVGAADVRAQGQRPRRDLAGVPPLPGQPAAQALRLQGHAAAGVRARQGQPAGKR
jgi:hypothetical protein